MSVNKVDTAALKDLIGDFVAALRLATPGRKTVTPWKGRMTKATSMQVGLLAKRIATAYPEFTAHFNTAKKAIEIYLPAGVSLSGIAKALAHPKSVINDGMDTAASEAAPHGGSPVKNRFHKILIASGFKITNTESDSSFVPSTKSSYTHPDGHKVMVVSYHNRITYAVYAHKLTNDNMVLSVINTESQLKMAIARSYSAYMRNPLPAQTNQKLEGIKDVNKAALKDLNTHTASNDFTITAVLNADDATKMRPTKIDIKAGDKLRCLRGEAHTEFRVNNERPGYLIGNVMFDRIIKPNLK